MKEKVLFKNKKQIQNKKKDLLRRKKNENDDLFILPPQLEIICLPFEREARKSGFLRLFLN